MNAAEFEARITRNDPAGYSKYKVELIRNGRRLTSTTTDSVWGAKRWARRMARNYKSAHRHEFSETYRFDV